MKINPRELKDFIEDAEALEDDYKDLVNAEPEIKKHLDKARGWAKMRYDRVTEPTPADPRSL